jgi:hypothetical protein
MKPNKNTVVAITRATVVAALESLGGSAEKMEKQSQALVIYAQEQGVVLTSKDARKEFVALFITAANEDKKWIDSPTKKGIPAVLDIVRLDGMVTDPKTKEKVKKCHVPAQSRKIAKGIYAAWQWVADNSEGQGKAADSIKKIAEGLAGLNTRADAFNEVHKDVVKAQALMAQAQALLLGVK